MQQAILECKKGSVYYWYTNIDFTKRTVFLLHGLTANHAMFDKQIEFLSGKYNVIVWDAPAHGKSRPYSNFSYEDAVAVMLHILNKLYIVYIYSFCISVYKTVDGNTIQFIAEFWLKMN